MASKSEESISTSSSSPSSSRSSAAMKKVNKETLKKDKSSSAKASEKESRSEQEKTEQQPTKDKEKPATKPESEKEGKSEEEVDVSALYDVLAVDPAELSDEDRLQQKLVRMLVEQPKGTHRDDNAYVLVKPSINKIHGIDSAEGSVEIEMGLQFWWKQDSCRGFQGDWEDWGEKLGPKIWKPIVEFNNQIEMVPQIDVDLNGSWYIRDEYSRYGVVNWYQKWKGKISLDLDLHDFPFDRQLLKIRFGCPLWSDDDIHLVNVLDDSELSHFNEAVDLDEWDIISQAKVEEKLVYSREDARNLSYLELTFWVRRKSAYYVQNIISLVFMIMFMGWGIYFVTPETLNDRIGLSVTLFLALVALNFVINENIPKVSYWTMLGQYFFIGYATTVFTVPQSVVSFLVNRYYCGVKLGESACDFSIYYDWICWGIVALSQIIYTIVFVVRARSVRAGELLILQVHEDLPAHLSEDESAPLLAGDSHIKVE